MDIHFDWGFNMKKVLRVTTSFSLAALLTFSSLMSPVVAAYGLNEAKPAEAVTDVASTGDDGVTSRGDDVEGSEATVDQSPVEGDSEAIDSLSQGATESEVKTELQVDSVESTFQYVYLAYPSLPSGADQVIAFATPNDGEVLSSATLGYVSANGVKGSVDASSTADNSAAFTFGAKLEANTYFLTSISYYLEGDGTEHKIDLSDRDYSFTVADSSMNSEGTSVYYADGDGNAVEAQSIQQALECADSPDGVSTYAARSARNVSVIALDAGHGGSDPGAQGNGKSEADLTWKIVTACKNKLEAYGFKVVLAREQYGNYSGNDFLYRVQRCIDQGAQAFVSFHINSGPSAAHGAEVYAPTANGSDYTQVSVELANKVMNNLAAMGLTYRGVFQMHVGDECAVLRCAREQGIPGILIEHGFISNAGDVWNYFSDEGCKRLGEADADAIISQFPKSTWFNGSLEYKKSGRKIDMSLKCSGGEPTNAAFKVESPSGRIDWVQAYDQKDHSWSASFDFDREYGVFKVSAYVTVGNETFEADSKTFGDNKCSLSFDLTETQVTVDAGQWAIEPNVVSYQLLSEGGKSQWIPAKRSGDSWICTIPLNDLQDVFGKKAVKAWCILDGAEAFPCGEGSFSVARPDVKLSCSASSGSLSVSATGFSSQPSNAAVQVTAPSGACRWYQAARGSDGSWAAEVPAAADFGDAGIYSITLWATFDTFTCSLKTEKQYYDGSRYPIVSSSNSKPIKMAVLFKEMSDFPSSIYSKYGASDIEQFCKLIYEESLAECINPDVVFAESLVETGWLKFGGQVSPEQCNFAGIGALDSGVCGASFNGYGSESVRMGIRAQVQHLKAYAGTGELVNQCIDPRFHFVKRGTAPFVEDLSGRWASDVSYGVKIRRILTRLYQLN